MQQLTNYHCVLKLWSCIEIRPRTTTTTTQSLTLSLLIAGSPFLARHLHRFLKGLNYTAAHPVPTLHSIHCSWIIWRFSAFSWSVLAIVAIWDERDCVNLSSPFFPKSVNFIVADKQSRQQLQLWVDSDGCWDTIREPRPSVRIVRSRQAMVYCAVEW